MIERGQQEEGGAAPGAERKGDKEKRTREKTEIGFFLGKASNKWHRRLQSRGKAGGGDA